MPAAHYSASLRVEVVARPTLNSSMLPRPLGPNFSNGRFGTQGSLIVSTLKDRQVAPAAVSHKEAISPTGTEILLDALPANPMLALECYCWPDEASQAVG